MDVNENIEKLIEDMRGCKNDWSLFNTKRNELFGVFLDAFQQGYKLRKTLNPETTHPAPPIGRCGECAKSPDIGTRTKGMRWCRNFRSEVKPADFCSQFEPKDGE